MYTGITRFIEAILCMLPLVRKDKRFFCASNEPCASSLSDVQRELAHSWTYDRLDVYGERRDTEQTHQCLRSVGMADTAAMTDKTGSVGMAHYERLRYAGEIAVKKKTQNQNEQTLNEIREIIREIQVRQ